MLLYKKESFETEGQNNTSAKHVEFDGSFKQVTFKHI